MKSLTTAWNHIRRSPYQALAAIMIMTVTFMFLTAFAFFIYGSSQIIDFFQTRPRVVGFFNEEVPQEEIDATVSKFKKNPKAFEVIYISKKQALEIYKEQNKDDPLLLDLVTEETLPPSIEVSARQIDYVDDIYKSLKDTNLFLKVDYQKDAITTLADWISIMRKVGVVISVLLALISVFVMAVIIGFKISNKRDEIEIMRLLSATKWYVRWPFILEGVIYGVVGALIGWGISSAALLYATPYLKSFLDPVPILPFQPLLYLAFLGVEIIVAIILGAYASFLSVLRYLK